MRKLAGRSQRLLGRAGQRIHWMRHFSKVKSTSSAKENVSIKNWFEDGATNVAYNCIDRHLHTRGHHTAIIWERRSTQRFQAHHL